MHITSLQTNITASPTYSSTKLLLFFVFTILLNTNNILFAQTQKTVSEGTVIRVRLLETLDSRQAKMGDIVNMSDPNFVINFSNDANKKETDKVKDVENVKQSVIVPKELFDDLLEKTTGKNPSYLTNDKGKVVFKKPENVNVLKERLALKYSVDVKTILTYDELLNTPIGSTKQYNVIIMPKGDGDRAAQRADVKMSFLCFH